MTVVESLKSSFPVTAISMLTGIPRSFIYYKRNKSHHRKSRVPDSVLKDVVRISTERVTYGYRRVWALLRNSGLVVNIKTVRRIMKMNNLSLPYSKHKNRTMRWKLTKPDDINVLWETDIHYVSTKEGVMYLMSVKDCFSKKWIGYELSMSCTSSDAINAVENAYMKRFGSAKPKDLVLRTDNGPQYQSGEFRSTLNALSIKQEYIRKQTPEDNADIESFHSSLKTDYIWVTELDTFEDARKLIEYAYRDYNETRPHSSIMFLPPDEFERRWNSDDSFRKSYLEKRKKIGDRKLERRKRRFKENVSSEDSISVQN